MRTDELISELNNQIQDAKSRGLSQVSLKSLEALVSELQQLHESGAGRADLGDEFVLEQYKAGLAFNLAQNQSQIDLAFERMRTTNVAGDAAIRTLVLINGGAAIALLAFLGHVVAQTGGTFSGEMLAQSMALFVGGVAMAGLAAGLKFLTMLLSSWNEKVATRINVATILVGAASLSFFIVGGCVAYEFFSH
jgi:hypothetical protein